MYFLVRTLQIKLPLIPLLGIFLFVASAVAIPLSSPNSGMFAPCDVSGLAASDPSSSVTTDCERYKATVHPTARLLSRKAEFLVTRASSKKVKVSFSSKAFQASPWRSSYRSYVSQRIQDMMEKEYGKDVAIEIDKSNHPGYPTCRFDITVTDGLFRKTKLTGKLTVDVQNSDTKHAKVKGGLKKDDKPFGKKYEYTLDPSWNPPQPEVQTEVQPVALKPKSRISRKQKKNQKLVKPKGPMEAINEEDEG
ncbi:uncharacterized protein C8R40DRAFT_885782 [Lentinula edodes]|uniref:uncharacterized protein n=1 Tax=Lentinula edodes TaxID=5353 RepID=UPI001E8D99F4|nr:uncharacterized protein C8R40DRAFT_885782 [Lentinula edodes]KAH7867971.1 hypothetical protein C8R40DRAFT_885782 [Lentinula edodes]